MRGWSWSSLLSQAKPLLDQKKISVVIQFGLEKHEDLPNVPLIMDLATTPENKAALRLITSRQSIARPFAAPARLRHSRRASKTTNRGLPIAARGSGLPRAFISRASGNSGGSCVRFR